MKFKDVGLIDYETKTAIIMRDGIYTYLAGEFPFLADLPPNKRLRVFRSKYAVQKAFERFKALGKIPVIFEHPEEDLDLRDYSQGYGYEPELVNEGLNLAIKCKLNLTDASKMAYDELGIREISCGWSGEFVEAKDSSQPYDYEQTFEEFNHIALVPQGRCGGLCSIKDSKGATIMKVLKVKDEQKSLFEMANKCTDEIVSIAKSAKEIEDSHAEGLLTAIQGLKETIKGLEAFASQENKEPELGNEEPEIKDEETTETTETETEEEKVLDEEETEEEIETEIVEDPKKTEEEETEEEEKEVFDEETEQEKEVKKELGIKDKCKDAKPKFKDAKIKKYLDARIVDAMNLGMKLACKRWHDVLPAIEKGLISFGDIKATDTPCDIKKRFVEQKTGKKINDSKELAIAFDIASKISFADEWKVSTIKDAKTIIDEKAEEINGIGVKNK